jgi:hypothetical protein
VAFRKDLIRNLRVAVQPGQTAVKDKLQAWPHGGVTDSSPALGSFLASKTTIRVRLTGAKTGVSVRIAQTPGLRGFRKAAKALNSAAGWRHRVFGRDVWVQQSSPDPGFFDDILSRGRQRYRAAILEAIAAMERRAIRK